MWPCCVCSASCSRRRDGENVASSRTYAWRMDSSCSARTSASLVWWLRSSGAYGATVASRRPASRTTPIGTMPGDSRRFMASTTRSGSAPARSILLTKIRVGTWRRWSARNSSGVCGWTPSTADTTSTAPSSTPRTRSTSAMKSGWPGVSTRLTARSPRRNEATADRIVMPRSRSRSSESVWVVPASTLPARSMAPAVNSRRSVRVVLPASTCARMPRLSVRMGPHAFRGGDHLLAGHGCSHLAPFLHYIAAVVLPRLSHPASSGSTRSPTCRDSPGASRATPAWRIGASRGPCGPEDPWPAARVTRRVSRHGARFGGLPARSKVAACSKVWRPAGTAAAADLPARQQLSRPGRGWRLDRRAALAVRARPASAAAYARGSRAPRRSVRRRFSR